MTPLLSLPFGWRKLARRFPLLHQRVKVGDRLTISTPNNLFNQLESILLSRAVLVTLSCRTWQLQHSDVDWHTYVAKSRKAHFVMS